MTDDEIQAAVSYLRDSARKAAQARAERLYLESWVKTVRAQETLASEAKTASEREAEGLASPKYLEALTAYKVAVEADEHCRFLRDAAEAKIEAWRTFEASRRGAWKA